MTTTTSETMTPAGPPGRPAPWRLIALVSTVVAVAAIGVAAFGFARDDQATGRLSGRDVAATQQLAASCEQWYRSDAVTTDDVPAGWCGHMTGWMYDQMVSGGMMGTTMWRNPQAMRDVCVQAMAGYSQAAADPAAWCQQMVDWMNANAGAGDWRGWMMNPSMMGR